MIRLRTVLQHKLFCTFFCFLTLIYVLFAYESKNLKSNFSPDETKFKGILTAISLKEDYIVFQITANEVLSGSYYFKTQEEKEDILENIFLGDLLLLSGKLSLPLANTNPNGFNNKEYLRAKNQYYYLDIEEYQVLHPNRNIGYQVKNWINKKLEKDTISNHYIKAFVLGDTQEMMLQEKYRMLGVSHLFAISGMHVSLLTGLLKKILEKLHVPNFLSFFLVTTFLGFYAFLTNYSASILRSISLYLGTYINEIGRIGLKKIQIFFLSICTLLLINPFLLKQMAFLFSAITSLYFVLFHRLISNKKKYWVSLITTSTVAWLSTLPLALFYFYQVNYLTIFYNMIFIPLVSCLIFPLSIISFFIEPFKWILELVVSLMEQLVSFFSQFDTILVLGRPSFFLLIGYFVVILYLLFALQYHRYYVFSLLFLLMFLHYQKNLLFPTNYLLMLDVGQGDAFLFHSNNKSFLIDTGGLVWKGNAKKELNHAQKLVDVLHSLGIRKLEYLFLTHGDRDHMGSSPYLIEQIKTKKVIFNANQFNQEEAQLINQLKKNKIKYEQLGAKNYQIGSFKIKAISYCFLDENDSSIIMQIQIKNYKMLFTGDASKKTEEKLIQENWIEDIDLLKIAHHGSLSATSKSFLQITSPTLALISAGRNNLYHHPHTEILKRLNQFKIKVYTTSRDGAVFLKFNKNVTFSNYNPYYIL